MDSKGKENGQSLSLMAPAARLKKISEEASNLSLKEGTKATAYVRSGREMLMSAKNYREDGATEFAYTLYMRYLTLFCEKIREHPGYKDIPPGDRKLIKQQITEVMPIAEELKKELLQKFEKDYEEYKLQVQRVRKEEEERRKIQEKKEEQANKRSTHSAPSFTQNSNNSQRTPHSAITPKVTQGAYNIDFYSMSYTPSQPVRQTTSPSAPPVNMIYPEVVTSYTPSSVVAGAGQFDLSSSSSPHVNGKSYSPTPKVDRTTKPSRLLSPMSSGLRQVIVPSDLATTFLAIAKPNTAKSIETCGILAGKILHGKLVITHVIIPKQRGTADSCVTENEEELFSTQDKYSILTMGWIHTHPTQTAFLSSVDLHTHYSYQTMMPEAVAIVCAPSRDQVGIFMLTPSTGMETIASCTREGFHPHPTTSEPLFEEANHAVVEDSRKVTVIDLRLL